MFYSLIKINVVWKLLDTGVRNIVVLSLICFSYLGVADLRCSYAFSVSFEL